MAVSTGSKVFTIIAAFALLSVGIQCSAIPSGRRILQAAETVFDVKQFGAVADGQSDDAMKFIRAWNAACKSSGPARLLIPAGTYLVGEVDFQGPCTAPAPIIIDIQGTLLANPDLSLYPRNTWITIEIVDGVVVTGTGVLNGQGEKLWHYAGKSTDTHLPVGLTFAKARNSVLRDITVLNSMGFHTKVFASTNITLTNLHITAPGDSPNTDGCHVSGSTDVTIIDTIIATGDDCVSIGDSNTNVLVQNVTCGPGHGLSVGSLGKRPGEHDVRGVRVVGCTLRGTTNGARIKSYRNSPTLTASNIVFEDLIMENVKNPIIIDQHYDSRNQIEPSHVTVTDVHFRNIRGTTITPIAINLNCSALIPCSGVELADINLTLAPGVKGALASVCENVKPTASGTMSPLSC